MRPERKTAIIEKVKVGRVDHYKNIMLSCTFDMHGTCTSLTFDMEHAHEMMKDIGAYDDIFALVGKPCEIEIDEMNSCHFKGMWKK